MPLGLLQQYIVILLSFAMLGLLLLLLISSPYNPTPGYSSPIFPTTYGNYSPLTSIISPTAPED